MWRRKRPREVIDISHVHLLLQAYQLDAVDGIAFEQRLAMLALHVLHMCGAYLLSDLRYCTPLLNR